MATFYKCDRCEKESQKQAEFIKVTIPELTSYSYRTLLEDCPDKTYDLCRKCLIHLNDCVAPVAKVASNEPGTIIEVK